MQTIDPAISRAKFEREIAQYHELEATYRSRGWFLIKAEFPKVHVVFAGPKLKPAAIVVAVELDFSDYDLKPPSVTFIDPFSGGPLLRKDLQFQMLRRTVPAVAGAGGMMFLSPPQDIVQANGPDDRPFICLPGIREYHDNPAHSGDPWLMHRGSGEGSLAFILEKVWTYGVNPIENYQVQLQPMISMIVQPNAIPE